MWNIRLIPNLQGVEKVLFYYYPYLEAEMMNNDSDNGNS